MKVPCELIVWHLLPSIRRELARSMVEDLNLTQRASAKKLGITESAVSQYRKSKRGHEMNFGEKVNGEIEKAIKDIAKTDDESVIIEKICAICRMIKSHGSLCELHKTDNDKLDNCNICIGGCK